MSELMAIKPIYRRSTKTYLINAIANASPLAAHDGYLVYEPSQTEAIVAAIQTGRLIPSWNDGKRAAVIAYLQTGATGF